MSRSISQAAAPRRLARVYCRILGLAVPAALAACADSLAPAAAGDPSAPAAAATEAVAPSADLLGALASDRIAFTDFTANHGSDIWSMGPEGGNLAHLTAFTGIETDPSWSYDHKHIAFTRPRNGVADIYIVDTDGTHKHWARSASYRAASSCLPGLPTGAICS